MAILLTWMILQGISRGGIRRCILFASLTKNKKYRVYSIAMLYKIREYPMKG